MVDIDVDLKKFSDVTSKLTAKNQQVQKAIDSTVSDVKSRAPAKIKQAVVAVYAIKSSEITAAGKKATTSTDVGGAYKINGVYVKGFSITYRGRRLTPLHFKMTPKTRPVNKKKYTVRATIYKNKKKALKGKDEYGTPVFLAPQKQGVILPFQRMGESRMPVYAIHTTSIPQMIENKTVSADIQEKLGTLMEERLEHNLERYTSS